MTDPMKREIERAIHDAEHPSGMSAHDGMARISAATLRRLVAGHEAMQDSVYAKADRIDRLGEMVERLTAQRDALLEALEEIHQATMKNKVVIAKYVGINFLAAIAIRKAKEGE